MTFSSINSQSPVNRQITILREQMFDLQRQLASGKKATTYGGLGDQRLNVLSLRERSSMIDGFKGTIDQVDIRLKTVMQHLERVNEIAGESRTSLINAPFDVVSGGQTQFQLQSSELLNESISLLNFELAGRYFFSGRSTDTKPVSEMDLILNGDNTRAGLKQIISERKLADLGADGRGRLVAPGLEASVLSSVVATPSDIGGVTPAQFTIDIGGNVQSFDISDGGQDSLTALEAAIDAAFGVDVASIVGGNQLRITAVNPTDTITITDIDAGAAALVGLTSGAVASPSASISLAQDADPSLYGFKLSGVTSTLAGTTAVVNAGPPAPSLDVAFTSTLPNPGDTLHLTLDLPDGTQEVIALTAVSGVPANPGEFQIGADEFTTAANFRSEMINEVETLAQGKLAAASALTATKEMFEFDDANPPLRVDGPPFETATGQKSGTPIDTVFWYNGEAGTGSARSSAVAKVDENLFISYGSRANEDAFTTVISGLALMAAETFSTSDPTAQIRFEKISRAVGKDMSFQSGGQSTQDLIGEFGFKQNSLNKASERIRLTEITTEDLIGRYENSDSFEVSARILALQTQLQASFEVTALLSRLSLVDFLR